MPSWQARLFDKLITALVRRRHWGDVERLKTRARRLFGAPPWYASSRTFGVRVRRTDGTIPGEWIVPDGPSTDNVILYFHGGGYVSCSPQTHRPITAALARDSGCRVLALDYRLAPEHKFPMAFNQGVAAYHWLLMHGTKPGNIALAGDSAGGGLALALLAALRQREAASVPTCAVAFSPWTDLAATGLSLTENDGRCAMFHTENIADFAAAYLGDASPRDPRASPLFADLSGMPPVLLHVSSSELLLDDARRVHTSIQSGGGDSTIHIFDGVPHGWQLLDGLVPEARASLEEAASFIRARIFDRERAISAVSPAANRS
jgi:monoterpene epsilon-lactone hydrolase